jgi:hypothetical protein
MPFAGPAEARDAVYGFLVAGLSSKLPDWDAVIIFDDKQTPDPPEDMSPYIRAQFRHLRREQSTVGGAGGRRFRAKFQLTLKVYTKLGSGMDDYSLDGGTTTLPGADTICQALLGVFDGKTTGVDQAQFYKASSQEYGADEGRYRTNVLVQGDYDTVR